MNERLQKDLTALEEYICIQKNCMSGNMPETTYSYYQGMYNGMIFSHSIFDRSEPHYMKARRKTCGNKIRHKCKK